MEKENKYISLLKDMEDNSYKILSIQPVDNCADLVVFEYGNGEGESAAIIYNDGTVFTQWDWMEPYPKSPEEIINLKWRLGVSEREGFVTAGLPRLL